MATTRIKLDGKSEGILELFNSNMAELGFDLGTIQNEYITDGVTKTGANRYFVGEESYDFKYLSEQGGSFVDAPDNTDVQNQALNGFILGQVLGGANQTTVVDEIREEASAATASYFADLIEGTEDDALKEFYTNLLNYTIGTAGGDVTRISQLYVPGWVRPQENYLTRKPLPENLNQNLLLPPSSTSLSVTNPLNMPGNTNDNGQGLPGHGNTNATFQSLYTRNRAGTAGGVPVSNPLFNNGALAGTAISLLQEPAASRTPDIIAGNDVPLTDRVPFTFEEDDAKYLTYDKRVAGFTSNGPNVGTQPAKMEPAVKQSNMLPGADGSIAEIDKETIAMSQGQYFPFVFSTINKKDQGWQTCFLQATLNSLSEAYNPTWQSKHFFGRSEQVHTYTFTDRTVDLSFTIFANEMRQLQNVYERVLWLAQQCYPDFDSAGRMSQGPIIAVRVGDLFQFKKGIIRSLSYDWFGVGGGKWEMTSGMRMPQGCTVTMNYQIMHDDIPSRDFDFYGGPAGGLNAATKRSRLLTGDNSDGVFGEFTDDLEVSSVSYDNSNRLIDAGNAGGVTYLNEIDSKNYAGMDWSGTASQGGTADIMNVPTGLDEDGDVINSETYEPS